MAKRGTEKQPSVTKSNPNTQRSAGNSAGKIHLLKYPDGFTVCLNFVVALAIKDLMKPVSWLIYDAENGYIVDHDCVSGQVFRQFWNYCHDYSNFRKDRLQMFKDILDAGHCATITRNRQEKENTNGTAKEQLRGDRSIGKSTGKDQTRRGNTQPDRGTPGRDKGRVRGRS